MATRVPGGRNAFLASAGARALPARRPAVSESARETFRRASGESAIRAGTRAALKAGVTPVCANRCYRRARRALPRPTASPDCRATANARGCLVRVSVAAMRAESSGRFARQATSASEHASSANTAPPIEIVHRITPAHRQAFASRVLRGAARAVCFLKSANNPTSAITGERLRACRRNPMAKCARRRASARATLAVHRRGRARQRSASSGRRGRSRAASARDAAAATGLRADSSTRGSTCTRRCATCRRP
jgi:hypothetical protein